MEDYKSPRVYVEQPLSEGIALELADGVQHYLKNVLRIMNGDAVRFFNGRDGEFVGRVENAGKKTVTVTLEKKSRAQKNPDRRIHLLFAPIKKDRMDWLVEKAVELGATDLHVVLTQNTDMRKINEDRMKTQIIEASEQCERLDIPALHVTGDMFKTLALWNKAVPIFAALERFDAAPLRDQNVSKECAILIGPSGGFTQDEKEKLASLTFIKPVSLGNNILRSETAVAAALSYLML